MHISVIVELYFFITLTGCIAIGVGYRAPRKSFDILALYKSDYYYYYYYFVASVCLFVCLYAL